MRGALEIIRYGPLVYDDSRGVVAGRGGLRGRLAVSPGEGRAVAAALFVWRVVMPPALLLFPIAALVELVG